MGRPISGRFGFLKVGEMRRVTAELMGKSMGFTSLALTPDTSVTGLSGGERQGLAIVRALHFEAEIIILDEPTMGLSLKETEKLLHFVDGTVGRQAWHLHRPQHLPRLLVADRILVLIAVGSPVSSRPSATPRRADGHHARGGGEGATGAGAVSAGRATPRAHGPGMRGSRRSASRRYAARSTFTTPGVADRHHRRLPALWLVFVAFAP
jgi:hypothetical protein